AGRFRNLSGALFSALPDVRCLRALRSLRDLVLDLLTLGQAAEPLHLDRGVVDEDVLAAAIRRDEPVAFRVVEPLHSASRHPSAFPLAAPVRRPLQSSHRRPVKTRLGTAVSIGTGARLDQGGLRGLVGSPGRCYCPLRAAAAETCSAVGQPSAQAPAGCRARRRASSAVSVAVRTTARSRCRRMSWTPPSGGCRTR